MPEFTYTGFAPEGEQVFPDGTAVPFKRGVPVELTADQAAAVESDEDWAKNTNKADKATTKKDPA